MKINGNRIETEGLRPWAWSPIRTDRGRADRRPYSTRGVDSPEKIQACLTCQRETCDGNCFQSEVRRAVLGKNLPSDPDDFRDRYLAGKTLSGLATYYGVCIGTVQNWRDRLGLPKRTKKRG